MLQNPNAVFIQQAGESISGGIHKIGNGGKMEMIRPKAIQKMKAQKQDHKESYISNGTEFFGGEGLFDVHGFFEMVKGWRGEMVKGWNGEMVKGWNGERVKGRSGERVVIVYNSRIITFSIFPDNDSY